MKYECQNLHNVHIQASLFIKNISLCGDLAKFKTSGGELP